MTVQKRVLVVEDDSVVADLVRFNLERAGFEVVTASNGQVALELLDREEFDLVVTDYQMPGINGAELCHKMRGQTRWSETPIVLLTAKALELDLARLRKQLGVREVFSKPFSPRALTHAVQECLAVSTGI
jgi:two-component system alkaline phosphatase synthesis response regulator PhoP